MNTVTVPATIHCDGCVASIKPFFNSSKKIKSWRADVKSTVKTVTAIGDDISEDDVIALLREAGYDKQVEAPIDTSLPSIGEPFSHLSSVTGQNFWLDNNIWKRASFNTLNCLIGCSIGDFGMIIYTQAFHPHISMFTQMALATIAGLCTSVMLETLILRVREKFDWRNALTTAFSMSFLSMLAMEMAMNTADFMITGGKANFGTLQYWLAFAVAAIAGFLVPLPYNYYKLKKYNKACH